MCLVIRHISSKSQPLLSQQVAVSFANRSVLDVEPQSWFSELILLCQEAISSLKKHALLCTEAGISPKKQQLLTHKLFTSFSKQALL